MTRYDKHFQERSLRERPWKIHPIWRGIGCLLVIISPIVAFSASHILIQMNKSAGWIYIPKELSRTIRIPIPGMNIVVPYLYAKLMLTIVLLFLAAGLLTILYGLIYQIFGPSRYGPLDARPIRSRSKRK